MKKAILLISALLTSTCVFAGLKSSSIEQSKAISSVWSKQAAHTPQTHGDITMVYGGEDIITRRPTIASHTAIA